MLTRTEGIKRLRADFGISINFAKEAWDASGGDMEKCADYVRANWTASSGRATNAGLIFTYQHPHDIPRMGVMLEVRCGSDFVAKTDEFKTLCKTLAQQVIAKLPGKLEEQPFVRDTKRTVQDVLTEYSQKLGETINVKRYERWELGGSC